MIGAVALIVKLTDTSPSERPSSEAAASADQDMAPFNALLAALQRPYEEDPAFARYAEPAPALLTAQYQTYCGT